MKKFKVLGTVFIMCALMMSMGAMVFGYDVTNTFLKNKKVTEGVKHIDSALSVGTEGTYPSQFMWNTNKTTGYYYFGYLQRLADGTYGGGSSAKCKMLSSSASGGKAIKLYFYKGTYKPWVKGSDNANFYTTGVILYHD